MKERRVAGLAVDTLSLDHGPSKDFKTHYLWLPSGRWGLENVANLDKIPASGRNVGRWNSESEGCNRRPGAPAGAGLTRCAVFRNRTGSGRSVPCCNDNA